MKRFISFVLSVSLVFVAAGIAVLGAIIAVTKKKSNK